MLDKKIDRPTLAHLLALDEKGVLIEWKLDKALKSIPVDLPKYKSVHRLLDVNHSSTINEISDAFRILECLLDIKIIPSLKNK